jgi:predicted nucleic acid-binding protein
MENAVVVDADVFIKHWRSKNKKETLLAKLIQQRRKICVSAVAKYEVFIGAKAEDLNEWKQIFRNVTVFAFDYTAIETARNVYLQLKRENKMIDISDILIASTAMANGLPLATLNRSHFERIRGLRLA